MYINRAMILGNLTRDPEIKSLPSGIKVATFSLATNRTFKDSQGKKQEATEYHNAVAFGKVAEIIAQYSKKGSSLYVDGRIQTRSWDAQDGTKRYRTEIVVENFQFGPRSSGMPGDYKKPEENGPSLPNEEDVPSIDTIEYPEEDNNLEDIPF